MFNVPKSANLECYYGDSFPDNSIQTFGYQFVATRNVTFSWESAVSLYMIKNLDNFYKILS